MLPPWVGYGVRHPVIVLFVAAIVLTLWSRMTSWMGRGERIAPQQLQQTITVVAVASPGEPVEPYVRLLRTATWPGRVTLRLFKMLGPQEPPPDESAWWTLRHAVRMSKRYGAFDRAGERMRLLRDGSVGSEFALLLGGPVEAAAGWDELLLRMRAQCGGAKNSSATPSVPFLTAVPEPAQVSGLGVGTYLSLAKAPDAAYVSRPFAVPPQRPQPSLVASAQLLFGPAALLAACAPDAGLNAANEDAVLSQALWMGGAAFFAPQAAVAAAMPTPTGPTRRLEREWSANDASTYRTAREWAVWCGKKEGGAYGRRAQLGLTPQATHEERYAKHGEALAMHGIQ